MAYFLKGELMQVGILSLQGNRTVKVDKVKRLPDFFIEIAEIRSSIIPISSYDQLIIIQLQLIINLKCRVKFLQGLPQIGAVQVRINFRGGNAFMSEHFLHCPQVGTTLHKVCCK
jgi:hypothetical protein